jgi:hypothetical protein
MESINQQKVPYEELTRLAENKLLDLFPEFRKKIESDDAKLASSLVGDILWNLNLPGATFHRFDTEEQVKLLEGKNYSDLFKDLSPQLIAFYRKKLEAKE